MPVVVCRLLSCLPDYLTTCIPDVSGPARGQSLGQRPVKLKSLITTSRHSSAAVGGLRQRAHCSQEGGSAAQDLSTLIEVERRAKIQRAAHAATTMVMATLLLVEAGWLNETQC